MSLNRTASLFFLLIIALVSTACETQTISEVKSDAYKYEKKDAHIAGVVTQSFAAINLGVYKVKDNTGEIWVVSSHGVPSNGARVEVKGRTVNAFKIGGIDYGTVLRESDRKVHG